MSLIGIIVGIVFLAFLTQAIFETVWGICLIIYGCILKILAGILYVLGHIILRFEKLRGIE